MFHYNNICFQIGPSQIYHSIITLQLFLFYEYFCWFFRELSSDSFKASLCFYPLISASPLKINLCLMATLRNMQQGRTLPCIPKRIALKYVIRLIFTSKSHSSSDQSGEFQNLITFFFIVTRDQNSKSFYFSRDYQHHGEDKGLCKLN